MKNRRSLPSPEIIIQHSDISRRVLRFRMLSAELVLDADVEQIRKTKRHKWVAEKKWTRLSTRYSNTMLRRDVPQQAIDEAIQIVRDSITYADY